jgi:double-strand break repair protein MRE11
MESINEQLGQLDSRPGGGLEMLMGDDLSEAVMSFVDKDEKHAIESFVERAITETKDTLMSTKASSEGADDIVSAVTDIKQRKLEAAAKQRKAKEREANASGTAAGGPSGSAATAARVPSSLASALNDSDGDDDLGDPVPPRPATNTRGRADRSARQGGTQPKAKPKATPQPRQASLAESFGSSRPRRAAQRAAVVDASDDEADGVPRAAPLALPHATHSLGGERERGCLNSARRGCRG